MSMDVFAHDRFLVDQLVRPIVNLYQVTPLAAGEVPAGGPIAYVRQKRMAIKEDIRFFADENETEGLFRIKARSMFDIGGARYDVLDLSGDHDRKLDRRLAIALAIGLDTLQNR